MKREKFIATPAYDKFLTKLRLARQEKGVSQRELARRLEWHWSKVIRSETGARAMTMIEVRAICEALQISVVDFTVELVKASETATEPDESAGPSEDAHVTFAVSDATGTG